MLSGAFDFAAKRGYALDDRLKEQLQENYCWAVNATENCVFSHIIFSAPPPEGFFSMQRKKRKFSRVVSY
jgi:hypothetical protein